MLKLLRILFLLPLFLSVCLIGTANAQTNLPSDLDEDTLLLAAALWSEARNDNDNMQLFANAIMNRKKEKEAETGHSVSIRELLSETSWQGKDWDSSKIIKQMTEYQGGDKDTWETCINYAKLAVNGTLGDTSMGATTYSQPKDSIVPEAARGKTEVDTSTDNAQMSGATMEEISSSQSSGATNGSAYQTGAPKIEHSDSKENSCSGVEAVSRDISSKTNSGYGVISDRTMKNMTNMLDQIYKNLGRVFMLGHGVLCYATKVAYTCFGIGAVAPGLQDACWIKSPNLSFFICGLAIYFTAFLMSIAIGMYFIDICFKLGFAIMYLPVAIALWPFAPTKSKFGEAFGMVLHNAMLYAFMSIGLTYAIVLIYTGILGNPANWTSFWSAIEKESSELLAENFSLNSTRIIVIMFCLVFGFKIIASSVNEYLDNFFSDGLLGGESPMHYLGTQALHFAGGATLGKMGAYTADVVETQLGKGVEGIGNTLVDFTKDDNMLAKISNTLGKPFKQFQEGINRVQTHEYKDPLARNDSVSAADSSRSTSSSGTNPATGGFTLTPDAQTNANNSVYRTATQTPTNMNGDTGEPAQFNVPKDNSGNPIYAEYINENDSRYERHTSGTDSFLVDTQTNQVVQNRFSVTSGTRPVIMDNYTQKEISQEEYNKLMSEASAFKTTQTKGTFESIYRATTPDADTLRPSNVIAKTSSAIGSGLSATAHTILHPQATYRTFKQLATEGVSDENSPYQNGKLILTNTGKIVFRKLTPENLREGLDTDYSLTKNTSIFAKNAAAETFKVGRATFNDTVGFAGRFMQSFGKDMQDHTGKKDRSWSEYFSDLKDKENNEKREKSIRNSIDQNLADQYNNDEG